MAKMSKTPYAILGMLSIEPMSGYDIRQMMRQSTANFWSESDGQLYPALTKLTKEGLVTCKSSQKGDLREKKVYAITAKGLKVLKEWLTTEAEKQTVRSEFMLKLFFGANVPTAVNLEHISAHRYETKHKLTQLHEKKKELAQYKDSPHYLYWLMSLEYGFKIAEAKLNWCDMVINLLEKKG